MSTAYRGTNSQILTARPLAWRRPMGGTYTANPTCCSITSFLNEPSPLGNTLVGLAYSTHTVATVKEVHKTRVLEELAKLKGALPES